jgi:hypothetical protein
MCFRPGPVMNPGTDVLSSDLPGHLLPDALADRGARAAGVGRDPSAAGDKLGLIPDSDALYRAAEEAGRPLPRPDGVCLTEPGAMQSMPFILGKTLGSDGPGASGGPVGNAAGPKSFQNMPRAGFTPFGGGDLQ